MTPELIGAAIVAITGLLGALGTYLSKRSQDQRDELEELRNDFRSIRKQLRLADQWTYRMTRALDQHGIPVPPPPDGLIISPGSEDARND